MTKTAGGTTTGAPDDKRRREIAGVPARAVGIGVLVVLALWFLFANLDEVRIQFWVLTVAAPLWIALLGALVVGGAIGWLLRGRRGK